ncbi:hypothetical protein QFZ75_007663 [Streptomyces sp. V3I8]|uniref:hypothetical protein n=1 Tax=Streptomyces sp. V3I8 TaxID=3042279 RepID=UPI0027809206|nr:hypothetical protein [Streptomyces sp. V3I8]MDQ1041247.1 hypothetical protein [Streptomyces sp. V3I8]
MSTAAGAGGQFPSAAWSGRPADRPATARRWWAEAAALARPIDHAVALLPVLSGLAVRAAVPVDPDAAGTLLAEHRTLLPLTPSLLSAREERLGEARSALTAPARVARSTGHLPAKHCC